MPPSPPSRCSGRLLSARADDPSGMPTAGRSAVREIDRHRSQTRAFPRRPTPRRRATYVTRMKTIRVRSATPIACGRASTTSIRASSGTDVKGRLHRRRFLRAVFRRAAASLRCEALALDEVRFATSTTASRARTGTVVYDATGAKKIVRRRRRPFASHGQGTSSRSAPRRARATSASRSSFRRSGICPFGSSRTQAARSPTRTRP